MGTEPFDRSDLQELDKEIKFLSPRYQKLVTALVAAYITEVSEGLDSPEIQIDVEKSDDQPLPSLEKIFDAAFQPGRRDAAEGEDDGAPPPTSDAKIGEKIGGKIGSRKIGARKIGGRISINLDDFR